MAKRKKVVYRCSCGHVIAQDRVDGRLRCPYCNATLYLEERIVEVSGTRADEVRTVTESLVRLFPKKRTMPKRSPWFSGSFYLAVAVVVGTAFAVIANTVSFYALPVVVIGSLLVISVVGALQLRQDNKLNQTNFLTLMALAFRQVPLLRHSKDAKDSRGDGQRPGRASESVAVPEPARDIESPS